MSDTQVEREVRAAKNQALYRNVNERIEALAASFENLSRNRIETFVCECADPSCVEQVHLSIGDYERVREDGNRFVVRAGHVFPDIDDVVATHDGYAVVAKRGAGAGAAEAQASDQRNGEPS